VEVPQLIVIFAEGAAAQYSATCPTTETTAQPDRWTEIDVYEGKRKRRKEGTKEWREEDGRKAGCDLRCGLASGSKKGRTDRILVSNNKISDNQAR
jgi:hypothetical protein